ncbi:alpha/beta hydrolase [Halioxenophilus sp. WMMB6]|uniref:alpha/beta hydrolase n=1 Tax=Halioxenophilus sp. WMMB6 TaxID=3073815 RepID=UPI00295E5FA2|nr:alpha/beta fold hydrolase [Halioxenophilus sp. WMMB6]
MKIQPLCSKLIITLAGIVLGIMVTTAAGLELYAHLQPRLYPWHQVELDEEYGPDKYQSVTTFEQYLALEERLFNQLEQTLYQSLPKDLQPLAGRFDHTSAFDSNTLANSDDGIAPVNWNHSQILPVTAPKAACLLIHGLSDAPYSLHQLATTLQAQGCWVVAVRLPGHGTAPAGLLAVQREDFQRVVRMAAGYLRQQVADDRPLYLFGYSMGASLALDYAIARAEGEDSPKADSLVLFSPAIGLYDIAQYSPWQERISHLPGLKKLAWNSVATEFDPYKYNSFAINAGAQIYTLTTNLQQRLAELAEQQRMAELPPILAFMSAVDVTVRSDATVDKLFRLLDGQDNHLVVYDINRTLYTPLLFTTDAHQVTSDLLSQPLACRFTLISNRTPDSSSVDAMYSFDGKIEREPLAEPWPARLFSLAHTSLPFSPDDSLYGAGQPFDGKSAALGQFDLLGERDVLTIPNGHRARLRYNPFYQFQEQTVLHFVNLAATTPD